MEKSIMMRSIKKDLIRILLGSAIGLSTIALTEKAYSQDGQRTAARLNYESTLPGTSKNMKQILQSGAYGIAAEANLRAQEAQEERDAEMKKQTKLLEEIKAQQESKVNSTRVGSPSYTPAPSQDYTYVSVPANRSKEELEKARRDKSPNTDVFFTYKYYVDKNNDDAEWKRATSEKRLSDYPYEFEGVGVKKLKVGEPVAFGCILNNKKDNTYSISLLHNGKKFFSETHKLGKDKAVLYYEYGNGMNLPGEYIAEWRINDNSEPVSRNKIIVQPRQQ